MKGIFAILMTVFMLVSVTACSSMTKQEKGTLAGAVVGGAAGAAIGGSGGAAVVGGATGAVVGGVIGHEITKD